MLIDEHMGKTDGCSYAKLSLRDLVIEMTITMIMRDNLAGPPGLPQATRSKAAPKFGAAFLMHESFSSYESRSPKQLAASCDRFA